MYKGYRYIDSDAHVLEPHDMWEKYLEPEFHEWMPRHTVDYVGDPPAWNLEIRVLGSVMPNFPMGQGVAVPGLKDAYGDYISRGFSGAPACDAFFINETSAIFTTFDGGQSWIESNRIVGHDAHYTAVSMADDATGWAVRDRTSAAGVTPVIYKTIDGGLSWFPQEPGLDVNLNDTEAVSSTLAIAIGNNGNVFRTADGVNWAPISTPTNRSLFGVHFASTQVGWIVGDNGTILTTADGGVSWSARA